MNIQKTRLILLMIIAFLLTNTYVSANSITNPKQISPFNWEKINDTQWMTFRWHEDISVESYDFYIYNTTKRISYQIQRWLKRSELCKNLVCKNPLEVELEEWDTFRWYVIGNKGNIKSSKVYSLFEYRRHPAPPTIIFPQQWSKIHNTWQLEFQWEKWSVAESYDFFVYDRAKEEFIHKIESTPSNSICQWNICSVTVENLSSSRHHMWYVRARNGTLTSGTVYSYFHLYEEDAPDAPEIIYPRESDDIWNPQTINFSWKAILNAELYNFRIFDGERGIMKNKYYGLKASDICNTNDVCSVEVSEPGLPNSGKHEWYISASNSMWASPIIRTTFKVSNNVIEKLLPDGEMLQTYKAFLSDENIHKDYFGVYPMLGKDSTLFLWINGWLPAGEGNWAIATYSWEDQSIDYIYKLNDNGSMTFSDMWDGIGIPWVDPCCGDLLSDTWESWRYNHEWDWWNFYFLNTSNLSVTKHRNLANVFHGWWAWYDKENEKMYYASSNHAADTEDRNDVTPFGALYSTTNKWDSWKSIAGIDSNIWNFRTYDVIGTDGILYIQWRDGSAWSEVCGIAKSINDGDTWKRIEWVSLYCATRLHIVWSQVVALSQQGTSFVLVNTNTDTVTYKSFADSFSNTSYHTFTQDNSGNIYIWTNDGRVMQTRDFDTWSELATLENWEDVKFNTIHYWEQDSSLILSNWWENANLWRLKVTP